MRPYIISLKTLQWPFVVHGRQSRILGMPSNYLVPLSPPVSQLQALLHSLPVTLTSFYPSRVSHRLEPVFSTKTQLKCYILERLSLTTQFNWAHLQVTVHDMYHILYPVHVFACYFLICLLTKRCSSMRV